jgi:hypothetical protein
MTGPTITRRGPYLIVATFGSRRSTAVLGAYGWSLCWRDSRRRLRSCVVATAELAETMLLNLLAVRGAS